MAAFATLPGELLTAIASYVDTPHFVVAVAADGDARAAVRRGVDEAERALRGMSVRGAEAFLLHAYRVPAAALSDRHAAGLVLVEYAAGYEFDIDIIPMLLAYRAVPDVETSSTIDGEVRVAGRALHYVSGSGHERSLLFASLLLDAGADINARCDPGNLAGRTALAWALADDCLGLCGIKFRASHAIDATCLRSSICSMARRFHAIDATLRRDRADGVVT